jgi:hypothetical protein
MSEKPRQNTCDLLQLIDEGYLTHEIVLQSALNWMSDDEVGEMALCEGFFMEEEDYEDDEEYRCFNCGSEVIKEDVSLGYCIACKYSNNSDDVDNTED